MNKERLSVIGVLASGLFLLLSGNLLWLLVMFVFSTYYGWNLGKRLIPADEYGT